MENNQNTNNQNTAEGFNCYEYTRELEKALNELEKTLRELEDAFEELGLSAA